MFAIKDIRHVKPSEAKIHNLAGCFCVGQLVQIRGPFGALLHVPAQPSKGLDMGPAFQI